jgi:penicillin amidase
MVKFDGRAIPYIEAANEPDLYLSQGFLTARDRIFQMDILRRTAEGKLSEIFGGSCLPGDRLARTIGCGRLAASEVNLLSPEARKMLEDYSLGVNLYLKANFDRLPLEFAMLGYKPAPWKPADSLAVMKYLCYLQDESWRLDDMRQRILDHTSPELAGQLFPEDWSPSSHADVHSTNNRACGSSRISNELQALGQNAYGWLKPRPTLGSTVWAIAGKNTDSGGAILACDKDELFSAPDLFYLLSLEAPGLHVAGATIPGVPGIMYGRNDYISWGGANLKADVQDLVIEEFSAQFPTKYKTSSGWQNAGEATEEIPVRFAPNVVQKVLITSHGPVLIKNDTRAVALAWTGNAVGKPSIEALRLLNRAKDWSDFQAALKIYPGPAQMFVYADHSGNIACQAAGDIPIRSGKADGTTLVTGWDANGQWRSKMAFDDLPSSFNPACGYVIAANQKVAKPGSTGLIGHQWCAPYRSLRLESCVTDIVSHGRKIGLPDCNELQSDAQAYLSPLVKREVSQALSGAQEIDSYQLSALDLLEHWDGNLKPDSAAGAIYESFIHTMAQRLLAPKLGHDLALEYLEHWPAWPLFVERFLKEKPAKWLPPEERSYSTFILTTFSQAVSALRLSLRSDDPKQWTWQAVHRASFRSALEANLPVLSGLAGLSSVGLGGDADTINAACTEGDCAAGKFTCHTGSTMRLLVDNSDRGKFYQSLSLGQSGQLLSPQARDQLLAWLRVDPLPLAFSADQIDKQTQHKLILTNAPQVAGQ